jgi:hypothetical protein
MGVLLLSTFQRLLDCTTMALDKPWYFLLQTRRYLTMWEWEVNQYLQTFSSIFPTLDFQMEIGNLVLFFELMITPGYVSLIQMVEAVIRLEKMLLAITRWQEVKMVNLLSKS